MKKIVLTIAAVSFAGSVMAGPDMDKYVKRIHQGTSVSEVASQSNAENKAASLPKILADERVRYSGNYRKISRRG